MLEDVNAHIRQVAGWFGWFSTKSTSGMLIGCHDAIARGFFDGTRITQTVASDSCSS